MIDPPTSHKITIDAAEHDHLIDSVTIFQTDRAEIKRRIQLQLKARQNQIIIKHLPSCLVEDSLRVQGTATITIFDVLYHSSKPTSRYSLREATSYNSDEEDEEVTEHHDAVEALKKQRTAVENQILFLDGYGRSVDGRNSNIENLERFLDMYGPRREALDKRIQELDSQVNRAEKALRAIQKRKQARETKGQRQTKIIVTVMSKEEGNAELTLAYVVSNASWIPIYEIRALVSSSPNSPSTIVLYYRALLTQTTGENWPEVALTLSTATPYRGDSMPTLSTWRIGLPPTPELRGRPRPQSQSWSCGLRIVRVGGCGNSSTYSRSPSRSPSLSPTRIIRVEPTTSRSRLTSGCRSPRSRSPTRVINVNDSPPSRFGEMPLSKARVAPPYTKDEPPPMVVRQADDVDAREPSITFNITGRTNIPSDQGNHKVLIAPLEFQIHPEWACIPRENENVFLRCKFVNSSEFTFLPGEASIFMGDSFVFKSQIQHVPPNGSFLLSFGIDPALRVTYAPVRIHKWVNPQAGATGPTFSRSQKQPKQVTTRYTQQITIRNTRPTVVPALHILDHVPVSNDSTVKVNVTSPQGLEENSQSTEGDNPKMQLNAWVRPQKGVRARWASPEMGGEGAIEWVCAIDAGDMVDLKLGWEVSAPEGTAWGTL